MSPSGQKRKWRRFQVMSALPHKADINARDCDVRFVPHPRLIAPQQDSHSADHFIGAREHYRECRTLLFASNCAALHSAGFVERHHIPDLKLNVTFRRMG